MFFLFLNHKKHQCGVYQYGLRVYDILKECKKIQYHYVEIETREEYQNTLKQIEANHTINGIVYNFHGSTMPWLNPDTIQKKYKNIGIPHEYRDSNLSMFNKVIDIEEMDFRNPGRLSFPRPIYENMNARLKNYQPSSQTIADFIHYSKADTPIFGSFGFGFGNKGFHKIVQLINQQYDKAIIKFVIPVAHFDPNSMYTIQHANFTCHQYNQKSGIELHICNEFLTNEDILYFLKSNTMNLFLYDEMYGRGISSAIDYAISVEKPIGISNSYMFRHFYDDSICLYNKTIRECLETSTDYCKKYLESWSNTQMREKMYFILSTI